MESKSAMGGFSVALFVLLVVGSGLAQMPNQYGPPIALVVRGKIVGVIGVLGGTSAQDGQSAKAGAETVK